MITCDKNISFDKAMIILAQYYAKESIENAYHTLEIDQVIEMAKMIQVFMTLNA